MKYVIFESPLEGIFPVVVPDHIGHGFIASSVHERYPGVKPISAGCCNVNQDGVYIWGKSVALNLSHSQEDYVYLNKLFGK